MDREKFLFLTMHFFSHLKKRAWVGFLLGSFAGACPEGRGMMKKKQDQALVPSYLKVTKSSARKIVQKTPLLSPLKKSQPLQSVRKNSGEVSTHGSFGGSFVSNISNVSNEAVQNSSNLSEITEEHLSVENLEKKNFFSSVPPSFFNSQTPGSFIFRCNSFFNIFPRVFVVEKLKKLEEEEGFLNLEKEKKFRKEAFEKKMIQQHATHHFTQKFQSICYLLQKSSRSGWNTLNK